jgi:uncharacterized LabA/DUF88 family protein
VSSLIVYVDGFNLYHGLKDQFGRRMLWLDLVGLANRLRPRSSLVQVRYFTAPVLDDAPAASRQGRYQHALLAHSPGLVEIVQGRYQKKSMTCRKCGAGWTHYEEKETDVNIATSLVSDAARRLSDSALIVSADSDLTPAVKAATSLHPGLFVAAAFPPKRYSAELKKLMPGSFHISPAKIRQSQLPSTVHSAAGRSYSRPTKWT